jgi:hypothetical protein
VAPPAHAMAVCRSFRFIETLPPLSMSPGMMPGMGTR